VVNGKGGKDRELPVVPRLRAILHAYLADVRPRLYHAAGSPFLFLPLDGRGYGRAPYGDRLERRWLWRVVRRVGALVGRPGLYLHALQRSRAVDGTRRSVRTSPSGTASDLCATV
jgi:integrase